MISWLRWLPQLARRAASRTACTAGSSRATSTPMMAITTSNSTSVKAVRFIGDTPGFGSMDVFRKPRQLAVAAVGQSLEHGQVGLVGKEAYAAVAEGEIRPDRVVAGKSADPQRIARTARGQSRR